MIEEPPPIVFAPSIERPSADIVERFRAPTSFIVDAMNGAGALDWRIKRLVGKSFVGVALTCDCGPLDNLAFMAALAESKPGDVFMVATNGYVAAAVTGDLLMYVARNRARRFVTDGLVRDPATSKPLAADFRDGVTPSRRKGADPAQSAADRLAAWRSPRMVVATRRRGCRPPRRIGEPSISASRPWATLERMRAGLKELPVAFPRSRMGRG